jgi:hypothetical protein
MHVSGSARSPATSVALAGWEIACAAAGYDRDAGLGAGSRQGGIFRQEAVAGVNGLHAFFRRQGDYGVHVEISLNRPFPFPDEVRLVSLEAIQAQAIFLGKDSYGAEAQLVGCSKNADRDFTAVEGQKFAHELRNYYRVSGLVFDARSREQGAADFRIVEKRER